MAVESSKRLYKRWLRGDESAATELYQRYVGRLNYLVCRNLGRDFSSLLDPDDICQSTFKSMFRRMRQGRFQFEDDADIWRLLVTIALNKVRNKVRFFKTRKRDVGRTVGSGNPEVFDSYIAKRLSREPGAEEVVEFEDTLKTLLDRLPPEESTVLQLRLEGKKQEEIAQALGVTDRTVRRILGRICQQVQARFGDESS